MIFGSLHSIKYMKSSDRNSENNLWESAHYQVHKIVFRESSEQSLGVHRLSDYEQFVHQQVILGKARSHRLATHSPQEIA